jgi:hypothetical protein
MNKPAKIASDKRTLIAEALLDGEALSKPRAPYCIGVSPAADYEGGGPRRTRSSGGCDP